MIPTRMILDSESALVSINDDSSAKLLLDTPYSSSIIAKSCIYRLLCQASTQPVPSEWAFSTLAY